MSSLTKNFNIDWQDSVLWGKARYNTLWCLIGCSIGDFGTIAFFQYSGINWPVLSIMILAIINGLLTSILLETFILMRELTFKKALNTAIGMSLISMVSMEIAMNTVDVFLTGGATLNWWIIPLMLFAGYVTPLPYNYWRLKVLNKSCCGQYNLTTLRKTTICTGITFFNFSKFKRATTGTRYFRAYISKIGDN